MGLTIHARFSRASRCSFRRCHSPIRNPRRLCKLMVLPHAQYAPDYRIEIGGEDIPPEMRASVMRISYQNALEGADRVEVTLANEGLQWLDHPLLEVDRSFNLEIGYVPGPLDKVFFGEITGVSA